MWRADQLGCYGNTRIKTPNLDWHYFQNVTGKAAGKGPCLYNLRTDPNQVRNVAREFPEVARDLKNKLGERLKVEMPPLNL